MIVVEVWSGGRQSSTSKTSSEDVQRDVAVFVADYVADKPTQSDDAPVPTESANQLRHIETLSSSLGYPCWRHRHQLPGRFRRLPSSDVGSKHRRIVRHHRRVSSETTHQLTLIRWFTYSVAYLEIWKEEGGEYMSGVHFQKCSNFSTIDRFLCFFVYENLYSPTLISLSARLRENSQTDLHETFTEGVKWSWDDLITFLVNSEKPRDAAMRNRGSGFVVLSHHSWFCIKN